MMSLTVDFQSVNCELFNVWLGDCCWTPTNSSFFYIMAGGNYFLIRWLWCPLCTRPARLVGFFFYSARSLKQQSADKHVATLGHIILILSHPAFALSSLYCVLSGETTYANCIVFGLTRSGIEPTIYRTRGEHANHNTTDVVNYQRRETTM